MPWQPAQGTQPLSPFDHQVAGQSSMLRYDKTTVCKPLIAREHFVYKSLPPDLAEFTPEYRGEIEVQLIEEDGYIQLYGLHVDNEAHDDDAWSCDSENHGHKSGDLKSVTSKEKSAKNRSTVRLLRSGSYEVSASTNQVFYTADSKSDQPHTQSLNPWSLKNHKRLLDKMRKSEHSHDKIHFILLKNVVADFCHPCILDLKIGSRLHGDDASSKKVASQSDKCRQTTSSTLGVRLCGMQVYQVGANAYRSVNKYHGRTLNEVSFRRMLYDFLHNGTRFRSELVQPIASRLSELIKCLEGLHSFRFYASSLLIIYDGDVGVAAGSRDAKVQESTPGITADSASVDIITDHAHSSKDLIQNKQLSGDLFSSKELCLQGSSTQEEHHRPSGQVSPASGLQSSKGLCSSAATQPAVEHPASSTDCSESAKMQVNYSSCDASSVYQGPRVSSIDSSCESSSVYQGPRVSSIDSTCESSSVYQGPRVSSIDSTCESNSVYQGPHVSSIDSSCESSSVYQGPRVSSSEHLHSVPGVFNHGVLLAELPTSNSATTQAVGTDPSKTVIVHQRSDTPNQPLSTLPPKPDPIKQILDNDQHLSSPENSKIGDTLPLQNNHWIQKMPNISDVSSQDTVHPAQRSLQLDTNKQTLEKDSAADITPPPCISSVILMKTHALTAGHTQSAAINTTEKPLPVTEYGVAKDDLIQIPHISVGDLAFNDKSVPEVDQPRDYVSVSVPLSRTTSPNVTSHVKQMTFEEHPVSNQKPRLPHSSMKNVKVDVKMIDFAHTTHQGFTQDQIKHAGPDTDYIFGLRNLLNLFQELLDFNYNNQ